MSDDLSKHWYSIPYEERLKIAEFIFQKITDEPSCSFRKLIYDRLGFKEDAYAPLYSAGGMTITNAIITLMEEDDEL